MRSACRSPANAGARLASAPTFATTCRPATLDEQLSTVRGRVSASAYDICFVVDDKRVLLGLLGRRALASDSDRAVETVMTAGPGTVRPSLAVDDARERMRRRDLSLLPVTRSDGVLMGVLRRVDFADATSSTRPAR